MQSTRHTTEFRQQALSKARQRGSRTLEEVATELNMSVGTLKGWLKKPRQDRGETVMPSHHPQSLPSRAMERRTTLAGAA